MGPRVSIYEIASKYTNLKSRGNGLYYGLCPIHVEDTPSFHVNDNLGVFYCFGCGHGGNVYQLVSLVEKVSISDVEDVLYQKFGIDILGKKKKKTNEDDVYDILQKFEKLYKEHTNHEYAKQINEWRLGIPLTVVDSFFVGRKEIHDFNKAVASKFDIEKLITLGLYKRTPDGKLIFLFDDRITFAIKNLQGKTVGFVGRLVKRLDDPKNKEMPKYMTTRMKKTENLGFIKEALDLARNNKQNFVYVVEGVYDALSLLQRGIPAVSLLGTHLTLEHINLLNRFSVAYFLLDNDPSGMTAYFTIAKTIINTNRPSFSSIFIFYPSPEERRDIDEILREEKFEDFLAKTTKKSVYDTFIDAHLKNILKDFPPNVDKSVLREELFKRLMKIFKTYRENEHAYNLMLRLCERANYPFETLIKRVDAILKKEISEMSREIFLLNKEYIPSKERRILMGILYFVENDYSYLESLKSKISSYPFKSKIAKALAEFFLGLRDEISEEEYSVLIELVPEKENLEELLNFEEEQKKKGKIASVARRLGLFNLEKLLDERETEEKDGTDREDGSERKDRADREEFIA